MTVQTVTTKQGVSWRKFVPGDVRIGEPRGAVLRISSRLLFVHHVAYRGMSLLGAGPGFRHEHQGPFSSFESQRFGQGWNLESRGVSEFCANAWFDSGYMSHGGRRPPIVHLVLLKRSLANHPTHSGPSDNPPGRSPSAHVHCVGPGEHSGPSSTSHGEDWSPPRGHDHWL